MLKKIRVSISFIIFALITFYFIDFAELLPNSSFHWLASIQFIPALMAFNIVILITLISITLLLGRIYCSSVCPMGIYQDIISWVSKQVSKKKKYKFSSAKNILRWAVLSITAISFLVGFPFLVGLVDPYSAYGRMSTNLFKPIYMIGNNVMESLFSSFGNYTFYKVDLGIVSIFTLIVSILTVIIIGYLAWMYGRTYCNTICPVGTILGFLSKYSLLKIHLDTVKCTTCGSCAKRCKASCINLKNHEIDYTRCVNCFNCLDSCKEKALSFTFSGGKKINKPITDIPKDIHKRQFLITGIATAVAAPAAMAQNEIDNITGAKSYKRQTPISPPGALANKRLQRHCTSCHLCISKCPSNVLKPAFMEYGLAGIMQPTMSFERGYCNYGCTVCSNVCPCGALTPLTREEKIHTQMGYVRFNKDICVVYTEETNCGACAEHCPTQAVTMIAYKDGLTIPTINPEICIGCGGCEYICPVRPYTAIYVEGNGVHKAAKMFSDSEKKEVQINDFGF